MPLASVVMLAITVPFRDISKMTPTMGVPYAASVLMIRIRPLAGVGVGVWVGGCVGGAVGGCVGR